jgi:acid stress chaperone HdeB
LVGAFWAAALAENIVRLDYSLGQPDRLLARTLLDSDRGRQAMNKFRSTYLTLALASFAAPPAIAQVTIDVAKITCDQLVLFRVAQPHDIAMWLSGYYNGRRNSTVVDVEKLKEYTYGVEKYCINDRTVTVMEAVEKVLGPRN